MRNLYKEIDKNLFINPEDPDDYKDCKFQSIGASIPELAVHLF